MEIAVPANSPFERPRRQIEREFGVPVPGEILPAEKWTQTALKKLPPPGHLDFRQIFGREAPIMLDIGCGNGRSTLASAVWRPGVDHLSSDVLPVVIRYATRRANQRGLSNIRFAVIGGRERDSCLPSATILRCRAGSPAADHSRVSGAGPSVTDTRWPVRAADG